MQTGFIDVPGVNIVNNVLKSVGLRARLMLLVAVASRRRWR